MCATHIFYMCKIDNQHIYIYTYMQLLYAHFFFFASELCYKTFTSTSLSSDFLTNPRIKREKSRERHEQLWSAIYRYVLCPLHIFISR